MGLLSSAQFFQSFVETKLDRHGILYRKVHETSDLSDTYIDEDGVRCRGFCGAYVDDLIVFSRSAEDHRRHLTTLFEVLSKENLYLNVRHHRGRATSVREGGALTTARVQHG